MRASVSTTAPGLLSQVLRGGLHVHLLLTNVSLVLSLTRDLYILCIADTAVYSQFKPVSHEMVAIITVSVVICTNYLRTERPDNELTKGLALIDSLLDNSKNSDNPTDYITCQNDLNTISGELGYSTDCVSVSGDALHSDSHSLSLATLDSPYNSAGGMDEFEASNFPSSLAGVVQDAVNSISHKEIITCTSFDDYSEGLTSFGDPLMVDGWSHNHLAVVSAQRISDNQEFMTKDLESTSLPSTQLVIGSGGDQSSAGCSSQNQDDRNHNYLSIASAGRTSDHRKAKSKDLDSSYLPTTLVLISGGVDQSSTGCSSANDSMEKISAVESIDSSSSSSHGVLHGEETYVARNRSYMENHLNGRISTGLHRSVGECRVRHPAGVAERKTSSACEAIVTEKKRLAKRDKAGKKACAAERYRSKVEVRKPHLNAKEVGDTSLASSSFTKTGTADVPLEEMSLDEVNNVFSLFQARQWAKIRQSP